MKKFIVLFALIVAVTFFVGYTIGVFYHVDFNMHHWDKEYTQVMGICMAIFIMCGIVVVAFDNATPPRS